MWNVQSPYLWLNCQCKSMEPDLWLCIQLTSWISHVNIPQDKNCHASYHVKQRWSIIGLQKWLHPRSNFFLQWCALVTLNPYIIACLSLKCTRPNTKWTIPTVHHWFPNMSTPPYCTFTFWSTLVVISCRFQMCPDHTTCTQVQLTCLTKGNGTTQCAGY